MECEKRILNSGALAKSETCVGLTYDVIEEGTYDMLQLNVCSHADKSQH